MLSNEEARDLVDRISEHAVEMTESNLERLRDIMMKNFPSGSISRHYMSLGDPLKLHPDSEIKIENWKGEDEIVLLFGENKKYSLSPGRNARVAVWYDLDVDAMCMYLDSEARGSDLKYKGLFLRKR